MAHFPVPRRKAHRGAMMLVYMTLVMIVLSACNGTAQVQQQADANKSAFHDEIAHAESIGVPSVMLKPIMNQAVLLGSTSAPFALFNEQPVDTYNLNLAQRYSMLTVEVQGLEVQATQQLDAVFRHDPEAEAGVDGEGIIRHACSQRPLDAPFQIAPNLRDEVAGAVLARARRVAR